MDKLKWCLKKGMVLIEPNERLAKGYLKMAEDSFGTMNRERDKNIVFSISAGYYLIYYSLYAVMQKIGIKCEIHSCSIEFMKLFLMDFYSKDDLILIETAFVTRNLLQYYVNKSMNKKDLEMVWKGAYGFFVESRDILLKLDDAKVNKIRNQIIKDGK